MWRARAPLGMADGSGQGCTHARDGLKSFPTLLSEGFKGGSATGAWRRQQYLLPPEMLRAHAPRWPCPEVSSGHFRQALEGVQALAWCPAGALPRPFGARPMVLRLRPREPGRGGVLPRLWCPAAPAGGGPGPRGEAAGTGGARRAARRGCGGRARGGLQAGARVEGLGGAGATAPQGHGGATNDRDGSLFDRPTSISCASRPGKRSARRATAGERLRDRIRWPKMGRKGAPRGAESSFLGSVLLQDSKTRASSAHPRASATRRFDAFGLAMRSHGLFSWVL